MEHEIKIKINWGVVGIFLFFLVLVEVWVFSILGHFIPDEDYILGPYWFTAVVFMLGTIVAGFAFTEKEWDWM